MIRSQSHAGAGVHRRRHGPCASSGDRAIVARPPAANPACSGRFPSAGRSEPPCCGCRAGRAGHLHHRPIEFIQRREHRIGREGARAGGSSAFSGSTQCSFPDRQQCVGAWLTATLRGVGREDPEPVPQVAWTHQQSAAPTVRPTRKVLCQTLNRVSQLDFYSYFQNRGVEDESETRLPYCADACFRLSLSMTSSGTGCTW